MENEIFQELVIEQFKGINSTLKEIDSKYKEHDKRFDSHFSQIKEKLATHDSQFETIMSQIKANTQILKALEHLAKENKADHDTTDNNLAEICGDVKSIRKDLSIVELTTVSN